MDNSSNVFTNCCSSKALSLANITLHEVSSVSKSATTMVEILHLSQNWDSRGMVAVSVSEVNVQITTPENSVAILEHQSSYENNAYM